MLESSEVGRDGRVKHCKMHDLLHELAMLESHKETKSLLKPGQELKEVPVDHECSGIRRISLIKNNIPSIMEPIPACGGLRSLLLCNNTKLTSISDSFFDSLKYLVVLDLSQTSIELLPASMGNLRHLKLLNLSGTNIKMLPKCLRGLKHLQFLDVSGCQELSSLHSGIDGHKYMVYLNVKGTKMKSLPAGISKLINLRTLKGAMVFKEADAALQWTDLKGLTSLQHLSVTLDAQSSVQGEGIDLEGTFGGMTKMRTLSIQNVSSSCHTLHLPEDMESMQRLEVVRIRRCTLPKWMFYLENLMVLVLEGDNSSDEYKGLQMIPNLKELRLSQNSKCVLFPEEFGERMAFSKLETLIIEDFESLESFPSLKNGAMPTLKHLRMKNCERLKQMPEALQLLTSLEKIEVERCREWEDGFWCQSVQRNLILNILNERRIKLTIDNFTVSIEKNIENDSKLKSTLDKFTVSRSRKGWIFNPLNT